MEDHDHKAISHVKEFDSVEEALTWAATRHYIEVQECSKKGKVIPLLMNNLDREVEWAFCYPTKKDK